MTNGLAFFLGTLTVMAPSILWLSILVWTAPKMEEDQ